jgi:hypothetical protein
MNARKRSVVVGLLSLVCALCTSSIALASFGAHARPSIKGTLRLIAGEQLQVVSSSTLFDNIAGKAVLVPQQEPGYPIPDLRAYEFNQQFDDDGPMAAGFYMRRLPARFRFFNQATSTAARGEGLGSAASPLGEGLPALPSPVLGESSLGVGRLDGTCGEAECPSQLTALTRLLAPLENSSDSDSGNRRPTEKLPVAEPDSNRDIYYKNKLEFSFDGGWLPINIPFPLDVFVGDAYNTYPLKYTLVPMIASLRWHMNNIGGPRILRGNWDLTLSLSVTAIPRGPESRYLSYIMGIRRNFVPRNSKVAPYFDMRFGIGNIDAKGPEGVPYAQGQDTTFTIQMGSGVRYNFNPRISISAGLNFMHISNMDLSQRNYPPYGIYNYGINVYGPMVGIDVLLGKRPPKSR